MVSKGLVSDCIVLPPAAIDAHERVYGATRNGSRVAVPKALKLVVNARHAKETTEQARSSAISSGKREKKPNTRAITRIISTNAYL
jgi:hypothetical protein